MLETSYNIVDLDTLHIIENWFKDIKQKYLKEEHYSLMSVGGMDHFVKYIESQIERLRKEMEDR